MVQLALSRFQNVVQTFVWQRWFYFHLLVFLKKGRGQRRKITLGSRILWIERCNGRQKYPINEKPTQTNAGSQFGFFISLQREVEEWTEILGSRSWISALGYIFRQRQIYRNRWTHRGSQFRFFCFDCSHKKKWRNRRRENAEFSSQIIKSTLVLTFLGDDRKSFLYVERRFIFDISQHHYFEFRLWSTVNVNYFGFRIRSTVIVHLHYVNTTTTVYSSVSLSCCVCSSVQLDSCLPVWCLLIWSAD